MTTTTEKLSAGVSRPTGVTGATAANGATFTSVTEIDNSAILDLLLSAEIVYSYASNPTVSKTLRVHLLKSRDGTNYEDVNPRNQIASISPAADTSSHRVPIAIGQELEPFKYKFAVVNVDTGQTVTATITAWTYNVAGS